MKYKIDVTNFGLYGWFYWMSIAYSLGLLLWILLNVSVGDRWWWLYLFNTFAAYLFLPLPLLFISAVLTSRKIIWAALGMVLLLWGFLYGELFLPQWPSDPPGETITVMTTNTLVGRGHPEETVAAIREANADLVAIQELDSSLIRSIQQELADEYPYQRLVPEDYYAVGLGLLSRYPLTSVNASLDYYWLGDPQIYTVDLHGASIVVINFHAMPPSGDLDMMTYRANIRQIQAKELVALIERQDLPAIALGDLNASDQNVAYQLITDSLVDAWREKGWGFGHTRRSFSFLPWPDWMVRIDYVFHTPDLQTIEAQIGSWDGLSDHRPVVARLGLK